MSAKTLLVAQLFIIASFVGAYALSSSHARQTVRTNILGNDYYEPVPVVRNEPLKARPLYNRPDLVSDEDLAAVLSQIQPRFDARHMKPNHIEHALRTWGVHATFQNPKAVSGETMLRFLTDTASFTDSWGIDAEPLLIDHPEGVEIRYGEMQGASYHHDHWLACCTEAGATLDTPIFTPGRRNWTLGDVLQQSLRDFRLDERETEWTAMGFALWIAPEKNWVGSDGRQYSFDLLSTRLMRGEKQIGVCSGTHRVYSLMLLLQLDEEYDILSDEAEVVIMDYLRFVRDAIMASQFPDGHWPSNWPDGADAVAHPVNDELYKQVIATGHHLEWLSIAPKELHPPEEQIKKAIDWVVATTIEQSREDIRDRYTFFSHVGAALANWRQVHPAEFWHDWEANHPWQPEPAANDNSVEIDASTPEKTD
ncbi:MAG: hypothetical protein KDA69_06025 [Planctomycetaceae bacterium]|nr:hypothetical protein [Planctomycetaceae bacterium]